MHLGGLRCKAEDSICKNAGERLKKYRRSIRKAAPAVFCLTTDVFFAKITYK